MPSSSRPPRKSPVEIVQAVGRVMRKAEGKKYGYIVLPVAIPPGIPPDKALNDNRRFAAVWEVLRALRSHDDRFDAEINRIDLKKPSRIIIDIPINGGGQVDLDFPPLDLSPEAIYAKIVEKCGDRKYWETWARDIADIFARLVEPDQQPTGKPGARGAQGVVRGLSSRAAYVDQ